MSVIQYACLEGSRILLTGDAGRDALNEAADFAPYIGLVLPGIERIQIPHHGSRRNVSTEVLDRWLGPRLGSNPGSRSEEHTSELQSLMRISYAVFCLKKKNTKHYITKQTI